jgi:adenylate cyclase
MKFLVGCTEPGVTALSQPKVEFGDPPAKRRKLTVILAMDVAGYSRLVAIDEEGTVERFQQAAAKVHEQVRRHGGRVFNTAGDAILVEFDSAVDATRCAIDVQSANNSHNDNLEPANKLLFRIGIAVGDVLAVDNGDLLGDGVNIAARLENLAAPGAVCVSQDVKIHVLNKIQAAFVDLGDQKLKNIPRPIRVYRLAPEGSDVSNSTISALYRRVMGSRMAASAAFAVVLAAILGASFIANRAVRSDDSTVSHHVPDSASSSSVAPRRFNPATVPMVTDRVRIGLADYAREPDFKAVAISRIGWGVSGGLHDVVTAERDALERCKRRDQNGDCRIYAIGDMVVWPPLPPLLPGDLHTEPLNIPMQPAELGHVKGVPPAANLETFLKGNNHKAFAVSEAGFSSIIDRPDKAEAVRLAYERCTDVAKIPCLILSVDGLLTVQIPHTHGVVRPYTIAGEMEMSAADKVRIAKLYSAKDWRALAKGASGSWYAVSEAASEIAAQDEVLHECRQVETTCWLRAIGNFRVDAQ